MKFFSSKPKAEVKPAVALCPKCQVAPHQMLKRPGFTDKIGIHFPIYEVGCLVCPARSQAQTLEEAVQKWNNREFS